MRESNGALWMFYSRDEGPWADYDYWPSDVFYVKSFNNGETWTPPNQCTAYAGSDFIEAGCMVEDKPFIVVCSDRWYYQFNLWYALDLITEDSNAPPAFISWDWSRVVRQGIPVFFNAVVDDESGVSDAGLGIWRGDVFEGFVPMADDGLHEDRSAGDRIWGVSAGPFNAGEWLYVFCYATDFDGNTAYSDGRWLYVPIVHDAGSVVLELFRDSTLGNEDDETVSAYWPGSNGKGYMSRGSLWVAGRVEGAKRVMDRDWLEWDWAESEGTGVFLGPGESDQDCDMIYDDRWASTAPIGLQVHQKSFQWSGPGRDDFIIFRYTVRRLSAAGSTPELYAGFFADADVPWSDWRNNQAGFDAARNMIYAYNASGNPGTYVGVRMLRGGQALHSVRAIPGAEEPETDDARFDLMAAGGVTVLGDTSDFRLLVTAPPFSPAAGDSFTVAFGLVLGNGLTELRRNADTMAVLYGRLPSGVNGGDAGVSVPFRFALFQNHPNPFNPSTSVGFRLPVPGPVNVKVYDIMGREAAVLADRFFSAGSHRLEWNASGIGSGVYFCRIQAGEFTAVRKMVLMK
ncbi:MAG: T9SS type A sorting domain-containing protein [bacterium]|nr:T9SS type A sorting domain-containing protein [bacterium]